MKQDDENIKIERVGSIEEIREEHRRKYLHRPTQEDMQNEYNYILSIQMLDKMLAAGLITQEEYNKVDSLLIDQYKPMNYQLYPNYKAAETMVKTK